VEWCRGGVIGVEPTWTGATKGARTVLDVRVLVPGLHRQRKEHVPRALAYRHVELQFFRPRSTHSEEPERKRVSGRSREYKSPLLMHVQSSKGSNAPLRALH
jgi:hypothetical protein